MFSTSTDTDADLVAEEWREAGVEVDGPRDEDQESGRAPPPTLTAMRSALAVPSAVVLCQTVCDAPTGGAVELPTTLNETANDSMTGSYLEWG